MEASISPERYCFDESSTRNRRRRRLLGGKEGVEPCVFVTGRASKAQLVNARSWVTSSSVLSALVEIADVLRELTVLGRRGGRPHIGSDLWAVFLAERYINGG